jgi:hypothetical protein
MTRNNSQPLRKNEHILYKEPEPVRYKPRQYVADPIAAMESKPLYKEPFMTE